MAVFNTFVDLRDPASYAHLLVTLREALPNIWRCTARLHQGATHSNSFIVAIRRTTAQRLRA